MITAIVILSGVAVIEAYIITMLAIWIHLLNKENERLMPVVLEDQDDDES